MIWSCNNELLSAITLNFELILLVSLSETEKLCQLGSSEEQLTLRFTVPLNKWYDVSLTDNM